MKRFLVLISVFLALCACKTQSTLHYPQSTIIRDSISITYKQGETLTPTLSLIGQGGEEQPTPIGVKGAPTAFRSMVSPSNGETVSREGAMISEEALSERTNKPAVPPTTRIRVDTVFVERWHTQYLPEPAKPIPRFYKDCTWGFFILLLLILGRIALCILKAVCLRR